MVNIEIKFNKHLLMRNKCMSIGNALMHFWRAYRAAAAIEQRALVGGKSMREGKLRVRVLCITYSSILCGYSFCMTSREILKNRLVTACGSSAKSLKSSHQNQQRRRSSRHRRMS